MPLRALRSVAVALLTLASHQARAQDVRQPAMAVDTIAFGSCNKPWKPQPLWEPIQRMKPQVFVWTGDAVYTNGSALEDLQDAIAEQNARPEYTRFLESSGAYVVGAVDDHDYGVNDGGKDAPGRAGRIKAFAEFLEFAQTRTGLDYGNKGERRAGGGKEFPERDGLYSEHLFGRVKLILLDTRTHRDGYPLTLPYWVTKLRIPVLRKCWGTVNTVLRVLSATVYALIEKATGRSLMEDGDMLGERQWEWLEDTLRRSAEAADKGGGGGDDDAAFHVIVSSVQVFTTNPFVESWGHFPRARRRLVELLTKYRPKGTLFLSGDVHFGELIDGSAGSGAVRGDSVVEVTSSGMTHHAIKRPYIGGMVLRVIKHFSGHRAGKDYYAAGTNFGTLHFDWSAEIGPCMDGNVHDANGDVVLTTRVCSKDGGRDVDWLALHESRKLGMDTLTFGVVLAALSIVLSILGVTVLRLCCGKTNKFKQN